MASIRRLQGRGCTGSQAKSRSYTATDEPQLSAFYFDEIYIMVLDFARTIGDGYPEYVDDELGYKYHAWEVISASESKAHQQIRRAPTGELEELIEQLQPLSDLLQWALARRHLHSGDDEKYFILVQKIADGKLDHPALHYPEIMVDLARRLSASGDPAEGRRILRRIEKIWPEFQDAIPLLEAQLVLLDGDVEAAHEAFERALEPYPEDVDLRLETAGDFQRARAFDFAAKWLERARRVAEELGDSASLVDIDLLERSLDSEDTDTDAVSPGAESL